MAEPAELFDGELPECSKLMDFANELLLLNMCKRKQWQGSH